MNGGYQKEIDYSVAIHIWEEMLDAGIIDKRDFACINKLYIDRYSPIFRSINPINNVKYDIKLFTDLDVKSSPE